MNKEFSTGAQIILARIESHPEEFKEQYGGKWTDIMDAIHERRIGQGDRLRGLTDEEVIAIDDKLREHIWAPRFNDMVMEKVLDPQKEERAEQSQMAGMRIKAQNRYATGWNDPALAQNAIQPGGMYPIKYEIERAEIQRRAEQLGLGHLIKKTINKLKL